MSLKAKIEAVIYASEEPVTLAQLAGLLGHEAQAELDHLDSAQHALALEEAAPDEDELNSEVLANAPEPSPRPRPSTPRLSSVICTTPRPKRPTTPGRSACEPLRQPPP